MLKKYVAIFFLSVASILMLTFTILPHHHHQEFICFTTSHCEDHTQHDTHSHDEGPLSNHRSCVSNLLQTEISRFENPIHCCKDGDCHHFILLPFLQPDRQTLFSLSADRSFRSHCLYQEKLHPVRYISEFSGRAPPYFC